MKINIILLGHKSGVGKDTIADILVSKYNYMKISFATYLKDAVANLYNFSYDQMYDPILKNEPDKRYPIKDTDTYYTPRQILQKFGQDQRALCEDIWATCACNQIMRNIKENDVTNFVIADFRFPNEYERVKKNLSDSQYWNTLIDIIPIKVIRSGNYNINFAGKDDISEIALDDFKEWKYIISNGGTSKAELERVLSETIKEIN